MTDLTVDPAAGGNHAGRKKRPVRTVVVPPHVTTVISALSALEGIIARARAREEAVVKVVHGPDDQRAPLRKALRQLTLDGVIQGFIPGEEWAPFHESARRMAQRFPALKDDTGFGRRDPRTTIVVVSSRTSSSQRLPDQG